VLSGSLLPAAFAGAFLMVTVIPGRRALALMLAMATVLSAGLIARGSIGFGDRWSEIVTFWNGGSVDRIVGQGGCPGSPSRGALYWAILIAAFLVLPVGVLVLNAPWMNS
jgi:hypothetical protein